MNLYEFKKNEQVKLRRDKQKKSKNKQKYEKKISTQIELNKVSKNCKS